jgi:hypothetical protein
LTPLQSLLRHVHGRRLLLVIDNYEHVVQASAEVVARLRSASSELRVLATSRETLRVSGEFDVVHVIHAADGMIPSDMSTGDKEAIEEERRLFYVALTRARDNLYVYFPLRFYRRPRGLDDAHHFAQLTRFLPDSVHSLFDRRIAGPTSLAPEQSTTSAPARTVDALLTALLEA